MDNAKYFFEKFKVWSGCILFLYVATHLLNHSIGIFGLEALEAGREVFVGFWRSSPLNYVVVVALVVHALFAIIKTVGRHSFRGLSKLEWTQIMLGLLAPAALIGHIYGTKVLHEVYGIDDTYSYYFLLAGAGDLIGTVSFMILMWLHGCIGLAGVLSTRRWYADWEKRLTAAAYFLPAAAVAGAVAGWHQATQRVELDPSFQQRVLATVLEQGMPFEEFKAMVTRIVDNITGGYFLVLALIFAVRFVFLWSRRRKHPVTVQYPDGSAVNIAPGTSVLEASLMGRKPHAHLCGGRGRCSTCRVRVYQGSDALSPPTPIEQRVLRQIGAAENIRLACQTYPNSDCQVFPILPAETHLKNFADKRFLQGADRKIAILFADLRGFTSFSENRLPFDVVFVLNQYFQAVGTAIEARGGYLDKFIGDGAMALFGIDTNLKTACKQAIEAAWEMGKELDKLNERLAAELPEPLKIGIGLHCGDAIVAKMGYKHTSHLTAIGDSVNTAARLEAMTKDYGAELIVSNDAATQAGLELSSFESTEISIRGKSKCLSAYIVPKLGNLPVVEKVTKPSKNRQPAAVVGA